MKKFCFKYSNNCSILSENISKAINEKVIDNCIEIIDNPNFKGKYYFSHVDNDISVFVIDVLYQEDTFFEIRNDDSEFIALCYNISSTNFDLLIDNEIFQLGSAGNNDLTILDSSLDCDVAIRKDCKAFNFYIFISKKATKTYLAERNEDLEHINSLMDSDKNTVIRFERINYSSSIVLNELQHNLKDNMFYDLFLKGAAYELLDIYIEHLIVSEKIVAKITPLELNQILLSQKYLLNMLEKDFPSIDVLSQNAAMSPTRYKNIFKKIIGTSPKAYFLLQKLEKSREMLKLGNSINDVSIALGYKNASHFVSQFKSQYGTTPKDYVLKF